eukprot:MONOS_804.1-p1 / transcript=MONOS_804.1 / gene=MONOS_804 / organism=Monocercomonoides_exilis_PA203 / gene_product=serine / transcript_product=serine / location=Mono_scaffold00013:168714-170837(-) / protein_length=599 / sequence_SO=supercontig / SO=protein_coding / is_pseudo=false
MAASTQMPIGVPTEYLLDVPSSINVDVIIEKLLSVMGKHPMPHVDLPESDIKGLICLAKKIILSQDILLELVAPLKICGDIHGQYEDLLRLFEYGGFPPVSNYLFLGDYVDRGSHSIEVICLLFAFKVKYPESIFLLRGNHECAVINRLYGFYNECTTRYCTALWMLFADCFNCLPLCAIINDKIFCTHGGLSPHLTSLSQITRIARPTDIPDSGLLCDLVWADPNPEMTYESLQKRTKSSKDKLSFFDSGSLDGMDFDSDDTVYPSPFESSDSKQSKKDGKSTGRTKTQQKKEKEKEREKPELVPWVPSDRGVSKLFSEEVLENFLTRFDFDLFVRAHQVVVDGYEFFGKRRLVTIFSAPNYCGEIRNSGAMMNVDESLVCSFQILKPYDDLEKWREEQEREREREREREEKEKEKERKLRSHRQMQGRLLRASAKGTAPYPSPPFAFSSASPPLSRRVTSVLPSSISSLPPSFPSLATILRNPSLAEQLPLPDTQVMSHRRSVLDQIGLSPRSASSSSSATALSSSSSSPSSSLSSSSSHSQKSNTQTSSQKQQQQLQQSITSQTSQRGGTLGGLHLHSTAKSTLPLQSKNPFLHLL